jgi:branched-chain amino acid transport system substrate-binding protein
MLAVGILLLASACSGGTPGSSAGASGVSANPIKIGLITPLSGPQPDRGKILQVAAELAVADINEAGGINGRQVELVVADDANDTNQGVTAAQRLIQQDKVVALTGILSSTRQEAIQPIAERAEVVVMGVIATSTGLTDGYRYAFRATGSNDTIGPLIAKLAEDNGATKVAILSDNTTYAQSLAAETVKGFGKTSVKIVAQEQYQTGAADVTPQILNIQGSGADAVVPFPITGADIALIAKTMVENDVLLPVFSHNGVFTTEAIKLASSDYEQLPGVWGMGTIDTSREEATKFYERMDKAAGFDVPQNEDAGQTYDAVMLLGEGLKKSGGEGKMALVEALESITKYVGIAGAEGSYYSFSKDKHTGLTGDYLASYKFEGGAFKIK